MSTSHVITRSVRDSAAMLDALAGREAGAPYATVSERPFLDELLVEPGRLRIGFHARPAYGRKVHPECIKAVEKSCTLLDGLGHHVEEINPGYEEEDAALNWCIIMIGNEATLVEKLIGVYGRFKVMKNIELPNRALHSIGQRLKALDFVKAKRRWRQLGLAMDRMLTKYDLILTPTLGEPPVRVGSQQPSKSDERSMKLLTSLVGRIILGSKKLTDAILAELIRNTMRGQMPFTLIANMTGQPAMSVPLHWTEDGLPCGVQFLGRFGDEATLLRLASQLEKAQPWADKKPKISTAGM